MSNVIQKHNWVNPDISYIRDSYVDEWDIQSAGFSALKESQLLTEAQVQELAAMPKTDRNIKIGLMQRNNPQMGSIILNTLAQVRQQFYDANNLHDGKILSIKKDAIIVVDSRVSQTEFGKHFKFINKGHFTSYLRVGQYEFYYNGITNTLICKGFGDEYEEKSLLILIKQILQNGENLDKDARLKYLQKIQRDYLNHMLPIEYYKDPRTGQYSITDFDFTTPDASAFPIEQIDITGLYMDFVLPVIRAMV